MAPDDDLLGCFARFAADLDAKLAARYGADAAAGWQWRVATEPNCECHWLLQTVAYYRFYDIVTQAAKDALGPAARVGPGNFPKGMKMDMVAEIRDFLANNATHPAEVLGVSYYAEKGNGYRHANMAATAAWMKAYADAMPPPALGGGRGGRGAAAGADGGDGDGGNGVELHFMEYGTVTNPIGRTNHEPGAFGAAFTAGGLAVSLEQGIDKTYHWTDMDKVGGADEPLLYGWSWLFAIAELLVGCEAASLATSAPPSMAWNETAVFGVAAADPGDGSVFATAPALYVLRWGVGVVV